MTRPEMAGWNLALRFILEISALAGLGMAAWKLTPNPGRWVAVVLVPIAAAAAWGTFNVINDPSRSGAAPVEVPGWVRLAIELAVLGAGALAFIAAKRPGVAVGFALLVVIHYIASWNRIEWLLRS